MSRSSGSRPDTSSGPTAGELKRRATALLKAARASGIEDPKLALLADGALRLEDGMVVDKPPAKLPDANPWDIALGR